MEVKFSVFTWNGKMLIPVDCDKSPVYILKTRVVTMKTRKRDNTQKHKWIKMDFKTVAQIAHRKTRKEKEKKQNP